MAARQEADQILADARRQADETAAQLISDAQEQARRIIADARAEANASARPPLPRHSVTLLRSCGPKAGTASSAGSGTSAANGRRSAGMLHHRRAQQRPGQLPPLPAPARRARSAR